MSVIANVLDHVDALVATVSGILAVIIAWADMRSRVRDAHRRLTDHDVSIGRLDGEVDVLKTDHVKALADIKVTMAEIKADVKIVRASVDNDSDKRRSPSRP